MHDERFLRALIGVINNCETKPKVAVRNAVRALAIISKVNDAKPKIIRDGILEALKVLLSRTAENSRQTSKKEVFSYAACSLLLNILNDDLVKNMIDLEYTPLLLNLAKQSLVSRPGASVFALSVLKKIAETENGIDIIIKYEGLQTLMFLIEQGISMLESNSEFADDIKTLLRYTCAIVNVLCVKGLKDFFI